MLALLLVGFVIFAAVAWFIDDANIKKLATFGAAVCMLVFVVLLILNVAGYADMSWGFRGH